MRTPGTDKYCLWSRKHSIILLGQSMYEVATAEIQVMENLSEDKGGTMIEDKKRQCCVRCAQLFIFNNACLESRSETSEP